MCGRAASRACPAHGPRCLLRGGLRPRVSQGRAADARGRLSLCLLLVTATSRGTCVQTRSQFLEGKSVTQMLTEAEDGGQALGWHRTGRSRRLLADPARGRAQPSPSQNGEASPAGGRRPSAEAGLTCLLGLRLREGLSAWHRARSCALSGPCHCPSGGVCAPVLCCHGGDRQGPGLVLSRGCGTGTSCSCGTAPLSVSEKHPLPSSRQPGLGCGGGTQAGEVMHYLGVYSHPRGGFMKSQHGIVKTTASPAF